MSDNPVPKGTSGATLSRPMLHIKACLVEWSRHPSQLILHLDVLEEGTGITIHNVNAVCEKGSWTITWEFPATVNWGDLRPLEAMKTKSPPNTITSGHLKMYEDALIPKVQDRVLELFLLTEYESQFVEDFWESVAEFDREEGRIPRE